MGEVRALQERQQDSEETGARTSARQPSLRARQPELFADGSIKVWCQPSAVVDRVIYRWQLEAEAEEHRQAVQLVDMFVATWTEESMHAALLLQRAQTGIAAGCTGLTQVTDAGFGRQPKLRSADGKRSSSNACGRKPDSSRCTAPTGHCRKIFCRQPDKCMPDAGGRLVSLQTRQ